MSSLTLQDLQFSLLKCQATGFPNGREKYDILLKIKIASSVNCVFIHHQFFLLKYS